MILNKIKNKSGFNLLTMSAVILILGMIMSATLGFYNINNIKRRTLQNRTKFERIESALQEYLLKNGKFPCPAPLNCNTNGCIDAKDELGKSKIDKDGNCVHDDSGIFASTNADRKRVLYGAIPLSSLGIANNYFSDSWGNEIVYVIPEELTADGALNKIIYDKNNNNHNDYVKDGILYLLISFNKNLSGAFSYDNKKSNYFTGKENMPINKFAINLDNKKFFYFYRDYKNFDISGFDDEVQGCDYASFSKNLNDGSWSEIDEVCENFDYSETEEYFNVPDNVVNLKLEVWGGSGGDGSNSIGGGGGYSYGNLAVSSGDILTIKVGGAGSKGFGGYNGGGSASSANAGGGGGRTEILKGNSLIIVAGGGGGGAGGSVAYGGGNGGGGSSYGASGNNGLTCGGGGGGNGTGASKVNDCSSSTFNSGEDINGGNGNGSSGAGGGGYGGGASGANGHGGGGGGGYIGGVKNGNGSNGINIGNGKARICYNVSNSNNAIFTFPKSKVGEVVFSNELCPNHVSYPPKSDNYYYLSNYRDSSGIVINNRTAKRCEKNGKWEDKMIYDCVLLPKCSKPFSIHPTKNWEDFDFSIVNMGIVKDKDGSVEMKCIFSNGEAKWYSIK